MIELQSNILRYFIISSGYSLEIGDRACFQTIQPMSFKTNPQSLEAKNQNLWYEPIKEIQTLKS